MEVVCDTAKVRFFKQITTACRKLYRQRLLFAILQKYDFSSKSQLSSSFSLLQICCLRYCKSTIFQANHNNGQNADFQREVVCDTAKVRFFKQITTGAKAGAQAQELFAILQKYDFSSKSQPIWFHYQVILSCLRYCKSTIFQANHNTKSWWLFHSWLFAILQKYDFSSKSQQQRAKQDEKNSCLRYCKSTIFQANHN